MPSILALCSTYCDGSFVVKPQLLDISMLAQMIFGRDIKDQPSSNGHVYAQYMSWVVDQFFGAPAVRQQQEERPSNDFGPGLLYATAPALLPVLVDGEPLVSRHNRRSSHTKTSRLKSPAFCERSPCLAKDFFAKIGHACSVSCKVVIFSLTKLSRIYRPICIHNPVLFKHWKLTF